MVYVKLISNDLNKIVKTYLNTPLEIVELQFILSLLSPQCKCLQKSRCMLNLLNKKGSVFKPVKIVMLFLSSKELNYNI
jgi:hypothetical protein